MVDSAGGHSPTVTLITGPVRSGKSRFAERLAYETGIKVTYVATARPDAADLEWTARLEHHRRRRPADWDLVETAVAAGPELAAVFAGASSDCILLVDSLGTWLADRMTGEHHTLIDDPASLEAALDDDCNTLTASIDSSRASSIIVGEEVGWGIVPVYASARVFRDVIGRLHQAVAERARRTYLVVCGIAVDLRKAGELIGARPLR